MTIDIVVVSTADISSKNEVFNLDQSKIPDDCILAGASWLAASSSIEDSQQLVLRHILSKLVSSKVWLFIGNTAWQPDSRMVRYRGLWNALKIRGVEISHSSEHNEEMVESEQGLKYFGTALLTELSVDSVIRAISEERCAYIVSLPDGVDTGTILLNGWSCDDGFSADLLEYVGDHDGLLIKAVGEFDDKEAGFVAIGFLEVITAMTQ